MALQKSSSIYYKKCPLKNSAPTHHQYRKVMECKAAYALRSPLTFKLDVRLFSTRTQITNYYLYLYYVGGSGNPMFRKSVDSIVFFC